MKSRIMGIYDVDPAYADRFADFVNQKEKIPFTVMAFTSFERLKEYSREHPLEILLIHGGTPREELEQVRAGQVITLAEGESVRAGDDYPSVYKYQSSDSIVREVMACYCEQPQAAYAMGAGRKASVIGVYSPVGRCLKTSFALTMGQLMCRDGKVLYMNFEEFSGLGMMTGTAYKEDLSDVLYYFRQESFNCMKLGTMVYNWGGMDYIPPVRYPEDLYQVEGKDFVNLINRIAGESGYETLILDLGQMGKRSLDLLEVCDVVYMPVKEDTISAAKIQEFDDYLEEAGREGLRQQIRRIKLPYHSSFGRKETYLEQLLWGELGDYVRQILKGARVSWES